MNTPNDSHVPSPAFVDALELHIRRELHAGATHATVEPRRFAPSAWARSHRLAAGAFLAAGLLLGAGGQLAYAQVQQSAQRTALEVQKDVERKLMAMRLERAKQSLAVAQQAYATGSTKRQSVLDAEWQLQRALFEEQRITVDMEELRRTAMPPRNELWAPTVGDRDFVMERLRIEAASAQEQLRTAESQVEAVRTAFRLGSQTANELSTVEEAFARNEGALERVARKLRLRERAISERMPMEQLAQQLQLGDAQTDLRTVQKLLTLAEARLEVVTRNAATGGATLLDVKRAEVDVLERRVEQERLARQLQVMQTQMLRKPE